MSKLKKKKTHKLVHVVVSRPRAFFLRSGPDLIALSKLFRKTAPEITVQFPFPTIYYRNRTRRIIFEQVPL